MSWLADPKNWFGRYAATGPVDWTPNQGFGLPAQGRISGVPRETFNQCLTSTRQSESMAFVTDPEELRTRAASIFERLRTSSGSHEEMVADEADGDLFDDEEIASPAIEADAAVGVGIDEPGTEKESPLDEVGAGPSPSSLPIIETEDPDSEGDGPPFALPGAAALGPLSVPTGPRTPYTLPHTPGRTTSWRSTKPSAPTRRALPRILAIANQKGGVGKTTTAVNLGASLAELGYRVLVVDLDPQGNATTGLGINARNLDASVYDVLLHDIPVVDCIEPSSLRNLFVVPATIDLAGAEIELVPVFSRELQAETGPRTAGRRFRLHLDRLSPVARSVDRQWSGRRRRGGRSHPVRVLRPRGPRPAAPQCQPGAVQPQSDARGVHDHSHHVRRTNETGRTGCRRGQEALRRSCLSQCGASHRATLRGTIVRSAHHCV